jgi:hypothetical protein
MTEGEAGGIDSVIDASFYSQGFPGPRGSKTVHLLHVARLSLQTFHGTGLELALKS